MGLGAVEGGGQSACEGRLSIGGISLAHLGPACHLPQVADGPNKAETSRQPSDR